MAAFRKRHPGLSDVPAMTGPIGGGDTGLSMISVPSAGSVAGAPAPSLPPSAAGQRVAQLQSQVANLQTQYTDNYPDVVAARRQLQIARDEQSRELAAAPVAAPQAAAPIGRVRHMVEVRHHRRVAVAPPEPAAETRSASEASSARRGAEVAAFGLAATALST